MRFRLGSLLNTAKFLLLFTIAYNLVEGVVAITAGVVAGSIALIAFGADSYLEVAAAGIVYWRFSKNGSSDSENSDERVERFVGWTFLILALAVLVQVVISFSEGSGAKESIVGISLAIVSITIMPTVALWKLRLAADLDIRSLAAESKETLACSYLSVTLLAGLATNAIFGWWWLDPITALMLVPWLVREGLEGVRETDDNDESARLCSCRKCMFGLRQIRSGCRLNEVTN